MIWIPNFQRLNILIKRRVTQPLPREGNRFKLQSPVTLQKTEVVMGKKILLYASPEQ